MSDSKINPTISAANARLASEERVTTPVGTPAAQSDKDEPFPRQFGRYELRALLGRGGMGSVYLAHDPQLERLVALKIPRSFDSDPRAWRGRFFAEARTAATLQHPNICPVFEVGEADAQPYLTMAYVEGRTLAVHLRESGPLPVPDAIGLVRTMAHAMAEAHDRGIVHRDLKPANVIIDRRGHPIVMDFGLALRPAATDDLRLTLSGVAMGTPAYMPPEQAGGDHDAIGPPADVYSLGVILYELLTGRVPFEGRTFGKLLAQIERDPPPLPSSLNAAINESLENIILKALAKVPKDRFPTAGAFAEALDAIGSANVPDGMLRRPWDDAKRRVSFPAAEDATWSIITPRGKTPRALSLRIVVGAALLGLVGVLLFIAYLRYGNPATQSRSSPTPNLAKPVDFPERSSLAQVRGHELLVDAGMEEMQKWLDKHKRQEHSVLWLDAVAVGGKPLFTGIAALDDRAPEWAAFLDLSEEEINNANVLLGNRVNGVPHVFRALSGFTVSNKVTATALLQRAGTQALIGAIPLARAETVLKQFDAQGYVVQVVRPFPVGDGQLWCAVYGEAHVGQKSVYGMNLSDVELGLLLEQHRGKGHRPMSLVAYERQGERRFAVTFQEDVPQLAWEVSFDLMASELNTRTAELAAKGFVPRSVTACPWDGAVRYAVVWVRDDR